MYPNLFYFFQQVFHVEIPFLRLVNTFGFFVALAFLTAARVLIIELKRKEKDGLLSAFPQEVVVGKPASTNALIRQFVFGFLFGYKFLGMFFYASHPYFDTQSYLFSLRGSFMTGIIGGGVLAFALWYTRKKAQLPRPQRKTVYIRPHERVGEFTLVAFVGGFIGAKVFHNLENWDAFIRNPIGELFSLGGLTFYGGLIVAGVGIYFYARGCKLNPWVVGDCFGPAMMIAYAVGRLGCQFSGDGDWGILNSAYISNIDGELMRAQLGQFDQALANNFDYYTSQFGSLEQVPHYFYDPSWLPQFFKAQNYKHNVLGEGFRLANCEGMYCSFLPVSVFPTPLYEFLFCLLLFVVIWLLRRRIKLISGTFALYLILAGVERFWIEKIRVNTRYHIWGLSFTQAEMLSITLIFISGALILYHRRQLQKTNMIQGK